MASYKGVSFEERGQEARTWPGWNRSAETSVRHVPGGNRTIIQTGGRNADTLALRIYCTQSQLNSLYGKVGESGALSFSFGSATAYLESITDVQEVLISSTYFATLNLIKQ